MVKENGLLWEVTFWEFFFVTVVLAGGAAYLTGRAVARSWNSGTQLAAYMILLTAACRFIHFALFNGTLLNLHYYIVDLVILLIIAFIGRQVTRAKQMTTQYSFDYRSSGPVGWARKT
jgi:GR25 family glycosyltransferase involved in LPS biosynthesis